MTYADRIVFGSSIGSRLMHAEEFDPTTYANVPYLWQPKLNGVRAVWAPGAGFFSRVGIPYGEDLTAHIRIEGVTDLLDGEFYCHGMPLQDINAAITHKRDSLGEDTKRIEFHVFDIISHNSQPYARRTIQLHELQTRGAFQSGVRVVDCRQANCMNHLVGAFTAMSAAGYEGLILKNPNALYTAGRTKNILKWKAWHQDAFKCVGFKGGKPGKYAKTLGALVFELPDNKGTFSCSGMTDEQRHEIWTHPNDYLNRMGVVQYLTLSRDAKPQNVTFQYWVQP